MAEPPFTPHELHAVCCALSGFRPEGLPAGFLYNRFRFVYPELARKLKELDMAQLDALCRRARDEQRPANGAVS